MFQSILLCTPSVTITHSVPVESSTAQLIWVYHSDKCVPLCCDKLAVNLQISVKQKNKRVFDSNAVYSRIPSVPFLQFQRAKKSDAGQIRGRELDFGKMIEQLYVP